MRLIFKLCFWGFVALAILPSISPLKDDQRTQTVAQTDQQLVTTTDAVSLALGVANDVRGMCAREPQLCDISQRVILSAVQRAKQGAGIVGSMVEDHRARQAQEKALITGSVE